MTITLTERAARHIQDLIAKEGEATGLRLGVTRSGCSGLAYIMDFTDRINDDDQVFVSHGVRLIVDAKSLPSLEGTELDYVREGLNQLFRFNNPNVTSECGCGESFSV